MSDMLVTTQVVSDGQSKGLNGLLCGDCRFDGTAPEPRKGIRGGHVPGSNCIPFTEVELNAISFLSGPQLRFKTISICSLHLHYGKM
jgi:hypothetical protein